ncbi:MAG: sulfotransferase family 2 domain-containing protein [Pseudomonadota bacterium]
MDRFDHFVVFAEMRTGSNFLETNINAFNGLTCHGEAFNPSFISYPNRTETLGLSKEDRDADPFALLARMKDAEGLNGFRYFNNHDSRILDTILSDTRCAKIILTRNPIDSYVSWKIAKSTGQWKLTDVKRQRVKDITFDADEFEAHLTKTQTFQLKILSTLQRTGQTAFYIGYDDLRDVDVMNGLAAFLECDDQLKGLDTSLKKQNPSALEDKVTNFEEMERALLHLDRFDLNRTPNFEPRRGPSVPTYVACATAPLLFLPLRGGPVDLVQDWMAGLDDVSADALITGFTQKGLRQWKDDRPGHRAFTVVRHPVARAHATFCHRILNSGDGSFAEIRKILRNQFKLPLPGTYPDPAYTEGTHHEAFLGFLRFAKANLSGQTSLRTDPHWATQAQTLQGFADFALPDHVLREDRLADDLAILAAQVGRDEMPEVPVHTDPYASLLGSIYSPDIEAAVRDAYQRDYTAFGFADYAA